MTMLAAVCGIGIGVGCWILLVGLFPAKPTLAQALAALTGADPAPCVEAFAPAPSSPGQVVSRLGLRAVAFLTSPSGAVPKLTARFDAIRVNAIRVNAMRARSRSAMSAFLDLTTVLLAGGAEVEQAMDYAASVGEGSVVAALHDALAEARGSRVPTWSVFTRMAERLDLPELTQLTASPALIGDDGAKVDASALTAMSHILRARRSADAEIQAAFVMMRVALSAVALFTGFLVYAAYPVLSPAVAGH